MIPGRMKAPAFTPLVLKIKDIRPIRAINIIIIARISTFFITIASPEHFRWLEFFPGNTIHISVPTKCNRINGASGNGSHKVLFHCTSSNRRDAGPHLCSVLTASMICKPCSWLWIQTVFCIRHYCFHLINISLQQIRIYRSFWVPLHFNHRGFNKNALGLSCKAWHEKSSQWPFLHKVSSYSHLTWSLQTGFYYSSQNS